MLGKLIFCASHGARSRVEKDAAIAVDAGSAGHNINKQSENITPLPKFRLPDDIPHIGI